MKKLIGAMIAATLVALAFTGCNGCRSGSADGSSATVKKDSSLKDLKKRKVLVLGLDETFAPMGFRNEAGEIVGFDVDLAKEVSKRLGVKFKAEPIDWNSKEDDLASGKIDCIWNGLTITEERAEVFELTDPYLTNEQVLVVHEDSPIQALSDMNGKTAGIQKGSSAKKAIDANADFAKGLKDVVNYDDNITAMNELLVNAIDGAVMDSVVASYGIAKEARHLRIIEEPLLKESYGIAFRKGDVALRDKVQEVLNKMSEDGTTAKIYAKWFVKDSE